jgi:protein-disulfide isomerase
MRLISSFLTALIIGLMPALALAADTPAPAVPAPVAAPAATAPAPAAAPVFTDAQKAAIEDVVRNLLIKKDPEIIVKSIQEMQARQTAEASVKSKEALTGNRDKIFNDPNAPVGGNLKGTVTVVEFYDYQCGYCKSMQDSVDKLLKEDKNVKFVYKEFPILGDNSVKAAKAALAGVRQGKFPQLHEALMASKEHLTDDVIFKIAKGLGVDLEKLKKDMADEAIEKMVKANQELGSEIGAHGTPSFVIGDQVYPGAMSYDQLKQTVDEARKNAKP